jgi:hypothetical protein
MVASRAQTSFSLGHKNTCDLSPPRIPLLIYCQLVRPKIGYVGVIKYRISQTGVRMPSGCASYCPNSLKCLS